MRTPHFLTDPVQLPSFGRRRHRRLNLTSSINKLKGSRAATRAAVAAAVAPPVVTAAAPSLPPAIKRTPTLNNTVTTTSCNERLHLVLSRRSRLELELLTQELQRHAQVKTVCVYTDSPLLSRSPLSSRQQRLLLTKTAEVCREMTSLQLDFSSEFGNAGLKGMVLDCDLLAVLLDKAPQLESLSLKDVPLFGNVQILKQALLSHPKLHTLELKWCTEINDTHDNTAPILPTLLSTFLQMSHLRELTLLLSSAHNLHLPTLAHSSDIQRLTLGLEQRHVQMHPLTLQERQEEQELLMHFLKDLRFNTTLQECTLFSHHWRSESTIEYVQKVVASPTSNLRLFHLNDYNYGTDDPLQLLQLAAALQANKKLQRFKLFSKKRLCVQVDKKTRESNAAVIDAAFLSCMQHNTNLQYLDIVHAGTTITDCVKTKNICLHFLVHTATPCPCQIAVANDTHRMISFYLMTNRSQARQQFVFQENIKANDWTEFVVQHKDNTPLIYFLLQENPSLIAKPAVVVEFEI